MFVILAGSGCRSNPRVRGPPRSPTGPERDLLQDGAADGEGRGGLSAADRQTGEQSSAYPCPIAKYVPHVPVPGSHNTVRLKEPRPLCCQSVLDSPSSAACCSPFGSGSSAPPSAGELILHTGPSGADRRGFQAHIHLISDHSAIVRSEWRLN